MMLVKTANVQYMCVRKENMNVCAQLHKEI